MTYDIHPYMGCEEVPDAALQAPVGRAAAPPTLLRDCFKALK